MASVQMNGIAIEYEEQATGLAALTGNGVRAEYIDAIAADATGARR